MRDFLASRDTTFSLQGGAGVGKCLGRGTPVLMFNGSVIPVEQVKAGDQLMGPDSKPRTVLAANVGTGALYRIVPVKGSPWICNDVHVLTLVETGTNVVRDVPLDVYLARGKGWQTEHKLFQPGPIHFPVQGSLPLSPYFLGVYVGISKPDPEIAAVYEDVARSFGLTVSHSKDNGDGRCVTHRIVGARGPGGNALLPLMQSLGGDAQRLPAQYLTASLADRRALLAGLLDTDGHLTSGCYEITQDRIELAEDIAFLARSVGLRVTHTVKLVKLAGWPGARPYQRLVLSGDATALPLRVPRKQPEARKQVKNALRTGFKVEPIGPGEYFGFTLDGDGRFLLGDFTVTHNTYLLAALVSESLAAGRRTVVAAPTHKACRVLRSKLSAYGVAWCFKPRKGKDEATLPRGVAVIDTTAALLGLRPVITEDQSPDEQAFALTTAGGSLPSYLDAPGAVLIVDEISMVSADALAGLTLELRNAGAKLLAVGDEGQLPPVKATAIDFTTGFDRSAILDVVMRQAADSRIIGAAWAIRRDEPWEELLNTPGGGIVVTRNLVADYLSQLVLPGDNEGERSVFIGYTNRTVRSVQEQACRKLYGHSASEFRKGELVLATTPGYAEIYPTFIDRNGRERPSKFPKVVQLCAVADQLRVVEFDSDPDPILGHSVTLDRVDLPRGTPGRRFESHYLPEDAQLDPGHPYNVEKLRLLDLAQKLQDKYTAAVRANRPLQASTVDAERKNAWGAYFKHLQALIGFAHPFAIT